MRPASVSAWPGPSERLLVSVENQGGKFDSVQAVAEIELQHHFGSVDGRLAGCRGDDPPGELDQVRVGVDAKERAGKHGPDPTALQHSVDESGKRDFGHQPGRHPVPEPPSPSSR